MDCLRFKEFTEVLIIMNEISKPHLFNVRVNTFISKSGIEHC